MPMAFKNAGLSFGVVATFTIGFICTYCVHILVSIMLSFSGLKKLSTAKVCRKEMEVSGMASQVHKMKI
jgi:amino acid permease